MREYERHAEKLDTDHSLGGAVKARLKSFGPIRALVFGAYGEVSEDVEDLLSLAADELARRRWRAMGATTEAEVRGYFMATLRRKLGLIIMREMARHRLNRILYVGMPRAVLESRMRERDTYRPANTAPLVHHGPFAGAQSRQLSAAPAAAHGRGGAARPRGA